jgi:8-oxo-dGTP diphosphatase
MLRRAVNIIASTETGKVLLILRAHDEDIEPDKWCLPGGSVEDNESLEQALLRELEEEVGCVASGVRPLFKTIFNNVEATYFTGELNGDIKISREFSNHGWFAREDIEQLDLAFNQKDVLKEYFRAWDRKEMKP